MQASPLLLILYKNLLFAVDEDTHEMTNLLTYSKDFAGNLEIGDYSNFADEDKTTIKDL